MSPAGLLASKRVLAKDWLNKEEDEAWAECCRKCCIYSLPFFDLILLAGLKLTENIRSNWLV